MASIQTADLNNPTHGAAIIALLDEYARHPMGGGKGLSDFVKNQLAAQLAARPHAKVLLAWEGEAAIGLLIAFEGFSTFACRPLLNIHDVVVSAPWRGQGHAKALFAAAEDLARQSGCCKLTLEVLSGNHGAQKLYRALGYEGYQLDPAAGQALFWQKKLD